jgi:excisionase family DNA binding protein
MAVVVSRTARNDRRSKVKALLTVAETAAETGLGERAIRDGIGRGEIPGKRFGRLIKIPLWWVEEQRSGPRGQGAGA